MTTAIALIIASIISSAFFSGVEIAFISSDKLHIELQKKKGKLSGKILSRFIEQPSHLIITLLIGNNLSLVLFGVFSASLLEPWISEYLLPGFENPFLALIIQTIISTIMIIITAEYLPKSLFMLNPDRLLDFLAIPIQLIYYLFYPITLFIGHLSRFTIRKLFRLSYAEDRPVFDLVDLNNYIKKNLNVDQRNSEVEVSAKIFNNALEFKTIRVRECMVPRTELAAVSTEDTVEDLKEVFLESGHSKVVVYKENIDDIIGYCHVLRMYRNPKNIEDLITPIIIVPETMLANELLIQFIQERKSLALVVDEFGGTSGLVSMEDIIEEIFGEIQDEHDEDEWVEEKINDIEFLFSARHEIDYLNDNYDLKLPEGDYDTVGGLILSVTEDIPEENEVVEIESYVFTIISVKDTRIDIVKLTVGEAIND